MRRPVVGRMIVLATAALTVVSLQRLGLLDMERLAPAAGRLAEFTASLFPPSLDVLPTLVGALVETVEISFVGTVLGFLISLPLAFLGTRTLFGPAVTVPARLVIGAVRTVPSILWAVVFVVGFGLGPAAGAMAVSLYTVGYLGKLYYEAFEAVDPEVLEAVRGVGSSRPQLIAYAVLPEAANAVVSQFLFMFEYNIRASTIMGFVGAGGIGFYMLGYLQVLQYQNLLTALLLTFGVVMAIDYLSARLRSLLVLAPQARPRSALLSGISAMAGR